MAPDTAQEGNSKLKAKEREKKGHRGTPMYCDILWNRLQNSEFTVFEFEMHSCRRKSMETKNF